MYLVTLWRLYDMGTRIVFRATKGEREILQSFRIPFHYEPTDKDIQKCMDVAKEFKVDDFEIEIRHNSVN